MKEVRVVVEFRFEEKPEMRLVEYVLRDALYEFVGVRSPENEYVAKRYPNGYLGRPEKNEWKIIEVGKRNALARALRNGLYAISAEPVDEE